MQHCLQATAFGDPDLGGPQFARHELALVNDEHVLPGGEHAAITDAANSSAVAKVSFILQRRVELTEKGVNLHRVNEF